MSDRKHFHCLQCGTPTNFVCTGCHAVHYCSDLCQRTHWPRHRADCERVQERTASTEQYASNAAPTEQYSSAESIESVDFSIPRVALFDTFEKLMKSITGHMLKAVMLKDDNRDAESLKHQSQMETSIKAFEKRLHDKLRAPKVTRLAEHFRRIFAAVGNRDGGTAAVETAVRNLLQAINQNLGGKKVFGVDAGDSYAESLYSRDARAAKAQAAVLGKKLDAESK